MSMCVVPKLLQAHFLKLLGIALWIENLLVKRKSRKILQSSMLTKTNHQERWKAGNKVRPDGSCGLGNHYVLAKAAKAAKVA